MENNGSSASDRIVRLKCAVQNYDWGRIGRESTVARLYEKNNGAEVEEGKPYSELWMGTHESGPSYVVETECVRKSVVENGGVEKKRLSLKDWIQQNPRILLGDKVFDEWGPNLPFLFKVLSVAKALSIQAHPDKELATTLHRALPDVYKDANHKPEMALALTHFEALCGFISMEPGSSSVAQSRGSLLGVGGAWPKMWVLFAHNDYSLKLSIAAYPNANPISIIPDLSLQIFDFSG